MTWPTWWSHVTPPIEPIGPLPPVEIDDLIYAVDFTRAPLVQVRGNVAASINGWTLVALTVTGTPSNQTATRTGTGTASAITAATLVEAGDVEFEVDAKAGTASWIAFGSSTACRIWVNLATGALGTVLNGSGFIIGTPTVQDLGGGVYRCNARMRQAANPGFQLYVTGGDNVLTGATGGSVTNLAARVRQRTVERVYPLIGQARFSQTTAAQRPMVWDAASNADAQSRGLLFRSGTVDRILTVSDAGGGAVPAPWRAHEAPWALYAVVALTDAARPAWWLYDASTYRSIRAGYNGAGSVFAQVENGPSAAVYTGGTAPAVGVVSLVTAYYSGRGRSLRIVVGDTSVGVATVGEGQNADQEVADPTQFHIGAANNGAMNLLGWFVRTGQPRASEDWGSAKDLLLRDWIQRAYPAHALTV